VSLACTWVALVLVLMLDMLCGTVQYATSRGLAN
jgi:hypothetical protein